MGMGRDECLQSFLVQTMAVGAAVALVPGGAWCAAHHRPGAAEIARKPMSEARGRPAGRLRAPDVARRNMWLCYC